MGEITANRPSREECLDGTLSDAPSRECLSNH